MHRLKAVLVGLAAVLAELMLGPLLVVCARSSRGRFAGLFTAVLTALCGVGIAVVGHWVVGIDVPAWLSSAFAIGFVLVLLNALAGAGFARRCRYDTGQVGSHFLAQAPAPAYLGWADIEEDFVFLAAQLITRLDPWMPAAEAVATRASIRGLADAVRTGPDYDHLARISEVAVRAWSGGRLALNHCYSYRPTPQSPGERFGLFVFLHGHGTNALVVFHALRPLADRLRVVLIAPTFGYGNWEAPGGVEAADRATRFGLEAFGADPARVFLAGYSQGGAGVSRAAAASAGRYAGLVFLSATMELSVIASEAFAAGWKGRPILVIQGERDHNVTPRSVAVAVKRMAANSARVTAHLWPESGHFLFFARLDEVLCRIADWAERTGA